MQQTAFQSDSFQKPGFQIDALKDKVDEGALRMYAVQAAKPAGGSAGVRLPSQ